MGGWEKEFGLEAGSPHPRAVADFALDCHAAARFVASARPDLLSAFHGRSRPELTALSYALSEVEDSMLQVPCPQTRILLSSQPVRSLRRQ